MPRTPRQDAIVALLQRRSWLTHPEIASALQLSASGIYEALHRAVDAGRILVRKGYSLGYRHGSTPDLYYHPSRAHEEPAPLRDQAVAVLAAYLEKSPILPEGSGPARRDWLVGLVEAALRAERARG